MSKPCYFASDWCAHQCTQSPPRRAFRTPAFSTCLPRSITSSIPSSPSHAPPPPPPIQPPACLTPAPGTGPAPFKLHTRAPAPRGAGSSLAGILLVLFACLDCKATLGGKLHYLLYALVPAMRPRMLMTGAGGGGVCVRACMHRRCGCTAELSCSRIAHQVHTDLTMQPCFATAVDEEGKLLSVPVRVGQAVDVVAQAGRPKTITGARLRHQLGVASRGAAKVAFVCCVHALNWLCAGAVAQGNR